MGRGHLSIAHLAGYQPLITQPPSQAITCPVMNEDSSPARNATRSAISSGVPIRRIGVRDAMSSFAPGVVKYWRSIGVSMGPGAMAFTLIPLSARSSAAALVSPTSPVFDAMYAGRFGNPSRPAVELMLTIDPPP